MANITKTQAQNIFHECSIRQMVSKFIQMKKALYIFLGLIISVNSAYSQETVPVLHDSLAIAAPLVFQEPTNRISLTNFENWKFYPGDDTLFARPDFDDSDWHSLQPSSENIISVTDSLWQGYGWWRFRFKADSTYYELPRLIRFNSNGAAEIYLDGRLIAAFGSPSVSKGNEILPPTSQTIWPAISIIPNEEHVLAVRFSFKNFDDYKRIAFSGELDHGFDIYFVDAVFNERSYRSILIRTLPFALSVVFLFIIMTLHLLFYIRFPAEKANFWIFLLTLHLFIIAALNVYQSLFDVSLRFMLYYSFLMSIFIYQFFCIIPYSLSTILKTKKYKLWAWLPWLGIPFAAIHYILNLKYGDPSILVPFTLAGLVLYASFFIIWDAYKMKRPFLWLISTGILSLPLSLLIAFFVLLYIGLTNPDGQAIDYAVFIFILIAFNTLPVCMSFYMGNTFFDLYGDLESSVKERTIELKEKNEKLETANAEIQKQRDEVISARDNLQQALDELKRAQSQLVQQEKLASLGQLTAGIAHEIKNPLNFVNNFSDISLEMIDEVRDEIKSVEASHELPLQNISEILDYIEANLRKIHEHGTRADGIVKSMLHHSRGGDGEMEPTSLNPLIKEYVNLAFHGMRAGKEPINVDIELDLDESIGYVPLIAEDFSRVILNLCNNAFDAMREKQGAGGYEPKLTVRTKSNNGKVSIEIEDNGPGIPNDIKDKILQPFFTTKKGTQGTGLGLSITNDIVKAHGGILSIDSIPSEKTIFKILLG